MYTDTIKFNKVMSKFIFGNWTIMKPKVGICNRAKRGIDHGIWLKRISKLNEDFHT